MANTVATWGGLEIELVSEDIVNAIETARGFLEVLNEALSVALAAGEIAKTFVTSNLNLARALVREIINQLRALVRDLFGLGVYWNLSDLQLLQKGTANLKGGYPAWERRMLAQLNNRNDPNRPDFTPSSTVLGVFFYVGVPNLLDTLRNIINPERFAPLMQFLRAFANLFGLSFGANRSLPVAVNLRAEYASPGNLTARDPSLALSSLLGRTRLQVVWNSAPAPGGNNEPEPTIPPCAFIVEVSCYPRGFTAAWIGPTPSGTGIGEGSNQAFTTGQYQAGNSGQPLVIFGGEDAMLIDPDVQWPDTFTPGTNLPQGYHPLYFYRDAATPEVIRKAFGKEEGSTVRYYNQKRFFVSKERAITQGVFEGNYSITLTENDLPLYCPIVNGVIDTSRAEVPRVVYVRVIPVSNRVDENNFRQARWKPRAWTSNDQTLVHIDPITVTGDPQPLGDNDLGTPSEVLEVLVPGGQRNLYARAIQTAIAITTLSRSDLKRPDPVTANQRPPEDSTYQETGLESIATEVDQRMQLRNPSNYYGQVSTTQSPQSFVGDLYPRIVAEADNYIRSQGELPQAVLDSLEPTLEALVNWKWSDTDTPVASGNPSLRYTVLESLQFTNAETPLSRNRKSTRRYYSDRNGTPALVLRDLETKWQDGTFGTTYHPDSVDSAPVIGPSNGASPQYWYARDLIPDSIYARAATVMALTSSQTARVPGAWGSQRVFSPRAATGTALTVLNKVDGFFNAVFAGLQTGVDGILRVIDFLQQRVREIQELIRRINTLLDVPFQISFPSAKALILVTNGTSGLITGLLSAQDKPQEGPKDYAGGGILVAGSAPSILIDLLAKGLQSSTGG